MGIFLKATACTLVGLIMYLVLSKQGKDISVLLAIAICCMLASAAIQYIEPVISLVNRLQQISGIDSELVQIMLRVVGIGLLTEITSVICTDAGNMALGKTLQLLASGVVLWLSVPLFNRFVDLIEEILLVI
jgi:stage III sporulation protein AD